MKTTDSQADFKARFENQRQFYCRLLESIEMRNSDQIQQILDREYQHANDHHDSYFQESAVNHAVRVLRDEFAPSPSDDEKEEIEYGLHCVVESAEIQFRGEKEIEMRFKERASAFQKSTWSSVKKLLRCALNIRHQP